MLAGQRQHRILEEVRLHGAVRVAELTQLLGVSDMTIRRDLDVLAASGLVEKVHGGATARDRLSADEPGFDAKSHRQLEAIGLTAGTTTWRLAHHVLQIPELTVVTNSIQVANVLHRVPRPDLTVLLTGGVRTPSDALVGPVAVSTVRSLHMDVLFMGVHGMTEDAGFTTPNMLEAETDQALIAAAERVVVVADHTKWGVRGLSHIARLDEVDVVVTDTGLPRDGRSLLGEHVQRLVLAPRRSRSRARPHAADGDGRP
jgi:DeoR/GlpR family transcriptional regulator of sugar metabolism